MYKLNKKDLPDKVKELAKTNIRDLPQEFIEKVGGQPDKSKKFGMTWQLVALARKLFEEGREKFTKKEYEEIINNFRVKCMLEDMRRAGFTEGDAKMNLVKWKEEDENRRNFKKELDPS